MVRVDVNEYAPPSTNLSKFSIGASGIASGRRPSKLMMRTRSMLAKDGVGVIVFVGTLVMVGTGVSVGSAVIVGITVNVGAGVSV